MTFEHVVYESSGHVARITLNRPEVLNAMQPRTCQELGDALLDYLDDNELWVAILTGSGDRAFCVGADLKYRARDGEERAPVRAGDHLRAAFNRCCKPIIAAVNGYAVGGGLEVALRCDIIVAADHAQFGLPEVRRGLLADAGGVYYLPRRLPYQQAMGMILTGRLVAAHDALRMGMVNEVVGADSLETAAAGWAEAILECSPLAVQAAKESVKSFIGWTTEPSLADVDRLAVVRRLRQSEDYLEGPLAFAEKRKPVWKGC